MENIITVIIASAVTAALVSGFFQAFNEWRRRNHDKKAQIFDVAIRLTELRDKQFWATNPQRKEQYKVPAPMKMFRNSVNKLNDIWNNKDSGEEKDS